MTPTCADIIAAVSSRAPLGLQESWDNSGLQVGDAAQACTGVLLALDPTEAVVAEAIGRGCNLVITHHPLLFRGLKRISGESAVERTVIAAIRAGVVIYSSHTALDSAIGGVSAEMAMHLGAEVAAPLQPTAPGASTGLGVIAELPEAMDAAGFVELVHKAFGASPVRGSVPVPGRFTRIALCGGSGGEFISAAIEAGAAAYVTADVRYHDFVDHGADIFILDIGHFESESCAKDIFYRAITEKFANFAVYYSQLETNPINYL